jgi:hypothetical protein
VVQFDPTNYAVTEGNQASITAVLSNPADRDILVAFSTTDGTARCKHP